MQLGASVSTGPAGQPGQNQYPGNLELERGVGLLRQSQGHHASLVKRMGRLDIDQQGCCPKSLPLL